MALRPDLRDFPGLSRQVFQHPLDSRALSALGKVPLLPRMVEYLSAKVIEQIVWTHHVASSLQVGPDQYADLYRDYVRLAQVLDLKHLPELYINNSPEINAYAMGTTRYIIVLCRGLMDAMKEDEVLAILGHELGHVKCNHMLYKTVAGHLSTLASAGLDKLVGPVGPVAGLGVGLALFDWYRKSELSCDRAAVLATQNPEGVQRALGKLAGHASKGKYELNVNAILRQAQRYEESRETQTTVANLMRVIFLMEETHPYPVLRVREVAAWADSREYQRIVNGDYQQPGARGSGPLTTPTGVICQTCAVPWEQGTPFCGACGASLRAGKLVCGRCFLDVDRFWQACPNCGLALAGAIEQSVSGTLKGPLAE